MDRETKKIVTPLGKQEIVLKAWITGREKRDLKNSLLTDFQMDMSGNSSKLNTKKAMEDAENKALETIIVSIAGKTDKIVETILDMNSKDYDFVVKEINKITEGDDFLESSRTLKDITVRKN